MPVLNLGTVVEVIQAGVVDMAEHQTEMKGTLDFVKHILWFMILECGF